MTDNPDPWEDDGAKPGVRGPDPGQTRFRLTVEYDGSDYAGWQRQENGPSIQQALEDAILAFTGQRVLVQGAGRTDAGVHASGQVAHADLPETFTAARVQGALNAHLRPQPISIRAVSVAPNDFHARFSAIGRAYLYRIASRRAPPALDRSRVWWVPVPLDVEAMSAAAAHLVGRHDFTSFRAAECQAKSPVKTLDFLSVARVETADGLNEIHIRAEARSFLHHQIRNIAGTLGLVGRRTWRAEQVRDALIARDRRAAGPTAPASGLCLTSVKYEGVVGP